MPLEEQKTGFQRQEHQESTEYTVQEACLCHGIALLRVAQASIKPEGAGAVYSRGVG